MDLFPLFNSIRISLISTILVFFLGVGFAYYISKLSSFSKGLFDCILTLPLVLPPTVLGFTILMLLSPAKPFGSFVYKILGIKLVMIWPASILASLLVSFPLMYRASRSAFESFDETIADSAKCLGVSNFHIFWDVRIPGCKNGLIAGTILSFARALGEYGATSMVSGYIPRKTATVSTTVYQLWQTNNEHSAIKWILINLLISFVMLVSINMFERKGRKS